MLVVVPLFTNLFLVPQVTLLVCSNLFFKTVVTSLIKKIICLTSTCKANNFCNNCWLFSKGLYLPLQWFVFDQQHYLKKDTVLEIVKNYTTTSLNDKMPKILVLEQIEYCSLEAGNSFLTFLENVCDNNYIIITTNNLIRVMPTIKSRCHLITLSDEERQQLQQAFFAHDLNNDKQKRNAISFFCDIDPSIFSFDDFQIILTLIKEFIVNDNNKNMIANFLLIKKLLKLREKSILFFYFLFFITKEKILTFSKKDGGCDIIKQWHNGDYSFLLKLLKTITTITTRFDNKINLNLLLNYFFITIYYGDHYGTK